jgi:hypothetical protein
MLEWENVYCKERSCDIIKRTRNSNRKFLYQLGDIMFMGLVSYLVG